ncbi:MAG: tetratricopeptide repeat protein [Acidimicrobiia bacterium]|nr:tetratricopeptide repeat protein [Acidimicrobiia bacterium]
MRTDRYSVTQVAKTTGLTRAQVRSLVSNEVVHAERDRNGRYLLGFDDVVLVRAAAHLVADGVTMSAVRSAIVHARNELPDGVDVSQVVFAVDGGSVTVSYDGEVWEPKTGQVVMSFDGSDTAAPAPVHSLSDMRRRGEMPTDADAEDWFLEGDAVEGDDIDAAEEAYRRAIELDASHVEAHLNLGRLLHARGVIDEALVHYRAAAHLDPADATPWFNIGVAHEDAGHGAEAIRGYEQALRVEPTFADAHYNLANLYEAEGSELAALRHRREYRKLRG